MSTMYFLHMPKGNKSRLRGHRPKVGGDKSNGTVQRTVKIPIEIDKMIQAKITTIGFSEYIRQLIEKDIK